MQPWFAAAVLALLMCFTLTCYFFKIPDALRRRGRVGYWGSPDAEFNWCEPDYLLSDYVAEPVNTVSNLALMVPPLIFLYAHQNPKAKAKKSDDAGPRLAVSSEVEMVCYVQAVIGMGSVLFHGSLRYSMQLCDEIPMLWYALACSTIYLRRLKGISLGLLALSFASVVSLAIICTKQHSFFHEMWRGIMSCAFGACVVVLAWGSTALTKRVQEACSGKRQGMVTFIERLHNAAFLAFVAAVLCWLTDNYFCEELWSLPLDLPYPHLHTWWHLLVGTTLYLILLLFQLDDLREEEKVRVTMRWFCLPAVVV
mmetsp:Transcript_7813/g.17046  ORF Transcript_7813/g.17046 Transcript_7813/m.17046 type:complete len:311 (+) Transcript_7813:71-1003(+)